MVDVDRRDLDAIPFVDNSCRDVLRGKGHAGRRQVLVDPYADVGCERLRQVLGQRNGADRAVDRHRCGPRRPWRCDPAAQLQVGQADDVVGMQMGDEVGRDRTERMRFWNRRIVAPRPRSNSSFSEPASTGVDALKRPSRDVGVPVPSSVTFISAALAAPLQVASATVAATIARQSLRLMSIPSGRRSASLFEHYADLLAEGGRRPTLAARHGRAHPGFAASAGADRKPGRRQRPDPCAASQCYPDKRWTTLWAGRLCDCQVVD